jgi:hypothetical protein
MGDMHIIYKDGSALIFSEDGVTEAKAEFCDMCSKPTLEGKRFPLSEPNDFIWICSLCLLKL